MAAQPSSQSTTKLRTEQTTLVEPQRSLSQGQMDHKVPPLPGLAGHLPPSPPPAFPAVLASPQPPPSPNFSVASLLSVPRSESPETQEE